MRRGSILMLALTAVISTVSVAGGQSIQLCPPTTGEPYLRCQVDRGAIPDTSNSAPPYPDMLRQARVAGSARVSFVVDANGRIDLKSVSVLDASHDLFISAVRRVLHRWMFAPAQKNGVPVAVRFDQIFQFELSPDSEAPPHETVIVSRDTSAEGVHRLIVSQGVRDPNAGSHFNADELLAAQRTALLSTAPAPLTDRRGRPRVTVCVTTVDGGATADSATLVALSAPGRRAVTPRQCPRTYGGMVLRSDRPRGWIDPWIMSIKRVLPWSTEVVAVTVEVWQGAAGDTYRCWVSRSVGSNSTCRRIRSVVS
jgi:TonB family protein